MLERKMYAVQNIKEKTMERFEWKQDDDKIRRKMIGNENYVRNKKGLKLNMTKQKSHSEITEIL